MSRNKNFRAKTLCAFASAGLLVTALGAVHVQSARAQSASTQSANRQAAQNADAAEALQQAPTKIAQKTVQKPIAKKAEQTAEKWPVEAFAQLDLMDEATISPDGQTIASMMAVNGQRRIVIMPIFNRTADNVFQVPAADGLSINWLRWVSNDHVLAGVTALIDFGSRDQQAYVSRLLSVNRKDGKVTRILWDKKGQDAADLLWISPDRNGDVLIAAQDSIYSSEEGFWPSVYKVNIPNNKVSRVKKGISNVQSWGVDHQGYVRYAIANKDKTGQQSLLYRSSGGSNFSTIEKSDLRDFSSVERPFAFVPGTDNGLYIDEDENDKSVVKEINIITGEEIAVRHQLPEDDIVAVRTSFDGSKILGFRTDNKQNRYQWIDEKLQAAQDYLNQNVKRALPVIVSYNNDLTLFLVWISSSRNPGVYYIYDSSNGGGMELFAQVNEQFGSKLLAAPRYIKYNARDGLEIEAVLTLPKGREAKNLPLVVMPHGGPWSRDYVDYDYWSQFLADRGYAVLQPNFRGSSGYGKDFQDKGYGQMGLAMQDDVTDGVLHLLEEGIIDKSRVCIVGASYGGYAAMWGVVKDPDMYRCSISIAGVANLRREVNDFGGSLLSRTYKSQWGRMSEDFKAVSPINFVEKIKVPMLLIHGKRDESVDYKQSVLMEKRMREAGKNVEMLILDEADHYFQRQDDRIALLSAMEKFLMAHNPPD